MSCAVNVAPLRFIMTSACVTMHIDSNDVSPVAWEKYQSHGPERGRHVHPHYQRLHTRPLGVGYLVL